MRQLLMLAVLFALTAAAFQPAALTEFDRKLERFHEHYNRFVRGYLGCPKSAADVAECRPALGTFDWAEFNHARREAAPLFDLKKNDQ